MPSIVTDGPDPRREEGGHEPSEVVDLGERVLPAALVGTRGDRWMAPAAIGAAVVILVAGIVLANRPDLAFTAASPSPSAAPSDGVAIASPRPSPSISPRPTRVIPSPPPCVRADWGSDPGLAAYAGFLTWHLQAQDYGTFEPSPPDDWTERIAEVRTYDPLSALRVAAGDELHISTSGRTCLASASATFVRLDEPSADPRTIGGTPAIGSSATGTFIAPEPGDWIVRFVIGFPVSGETRWFEAWSRLLVGDGAAPPAPAVLPNAPCGPVSGPADAVLYLDSLAVPGAAPGTGASEPMTVPFGAVAEIRLAADRCATGWVIRGVPRPSPQRDPTTYEIAYRSPTPDPAVASQNRFHFVPDEPFGTWDISATFSFADGTTMSRGWTVTYEEVIVPPLVVARQGGTTSVMAWIGCGVYIVGPGGGSSGGDDCASNLPAEPLERIVVTAGSRLTFDVPGWEIADWGANAGTIAGEIPNFAWMDGGQLRYASSPPVDFPAPKAGAWALQLYATLVRPDGLRINGSWFALIDVR